MKKNTLFETIKKYRGKSVFFKYFFNFLIIMMIIFIPYNIFLYQYYHKLFDSELKNQISINAYKSKDIFDLLTSSFNTTYNQLSETKYMADYLLDNNQIDFITNIVSSIVSSYEYIDEVYVYSLKNNNYISSTGLTKVDNYKDYAWITTYESTKLPEVIFSRKINSDIFNYLYICKELYDDDYNVIGIFCIQIKYSDFEEIVTKAFEEEPQEIFIVSDIGLILYSSDYSLINTTVFEREDIYSAFTLANATHGGSFNYSDYIISVAKSFNSNIILMSYMNADDIIENFSPEYILVTSIIIVITALIVAFVISMKQYQSVFVVLRNLENIENLDNNNELLSEFFFISNTISNLSKKNKNIRDELSDKMLSLKKAQIAALQSQINPHFLFNTLQLINLSIIQEAKKDTVATNLISQLCELLHTTYDTSNFIVTVEEELKNAKQYLNIQKIRYKNRLNFDINVDLKCLSCNTLKLLLQPFIENSIIHGLKGKDADWQLFINIFMTEDEFLVYEIIDNGIGMSEQKIQEIYKNLLNVKINSQHNIGINNVSSRLKLLFGNEYNITIDCSDNTKITVRHKIMK